VPVKKKPAGRRGKNRKTSLGIIFWTAFVVVMAALFIINWQIIKKTLADTHLLDRIFGRTTESVSEQEPPSGTPDAKAPDGVPPGGKTAPEAAAPDGQTGQTPAVETPAQSAPETVPSAPAEQAPTVSPAAGAGAATPSTELRKRVLYFIRIDNEGTLLRVPVTREMPASGSPLADVMESLLRGPTAQEKNLRLTSLIPEGVRLISCKVTGETASINFDEAFMFNSNGAEGYIAQLRQIVWTATEFPNIKNVQILIEGSKVDFLGERIRIGSPISRTTY
jgi:spore germination protein GerM